MTQTYIDKSNASQRPAPLTQVCILAGSEHETIKKHTPNKAYVVKLRLATSQNRLEGSQPVADQSFNNHRFQFLERCIEQAGGYFHRSG